MAPDIPAKGDNGCQGLGQKQSPEADSKTRQLTREPLGPKTGAILLFRGRQRIMLLEERPMAGVVGFCVLFQLFRKFKGYESVCQVGKRVCLQTEFVQPLHGGALLHPTFMQSKERSGGRNPNRCQWHGLAHQSVCWIQRKVTWGRHYRPQRQMRSLFCKSR